MDIAQLFQLALQDHMAGRFSEARQTYGTILAQHPTHADSLHGLAVIEHQAGAHARALELVDRAIIANGRIHDYHNTRANILRSLNRTDDALASCAAAIALKPDYPEAWYTQALCQQLLKQLDAAVVSFSKAIQSRPDFVLALQRLSVLHDLRGELDKALAIHQKLIRLTPNSGEAFNALGVVLGKKSLFTQSTLALRKAVELEAGNPAYHFHLGIALEQQKLYAQAEDEYRKAVDLRPNFPDALFNLGNVLQQQNRCEDLLPVLHRLIELDPKRVSAHINVGVAMIRLGRFEEAKTASQAAIAIDPTSAHAHINLALAHLKQGQLEEAEHWCQKAIALEPDNAEHHGTLANIYLVGGDFENGWREYECRWQCKSFKDLRRTFNSPQWTGAEDLNGKTILVHAEQGLGDAIQMASYVPLLKERGARVVLDLTVELVSLLKQLVPADATNRGPVEQLKYDYHVPMMSLPLAFGTRVKTIPNNVPYLAADPSLVEQWRQKLTPYADTLKVAIAWAGRPSHEQDAYRSCKLADFAPLADVLGVTFFSVQKGPASKQASSPPTGMKLIDLSPELTDFSQTAAALSQMDLLISVDTAPVHLAGAMGKPVWTLLAYAPDFRWMLNRTDTPWYPTMKLFRQPAFNNWKAVFEQVTEALTRLRDQKAR